MNSLGVHIITQHSNYLPRHGIIIENNQVVCTIPNPNNPLISKVVYMPIERFIGKAQLTSVTYNNIPRFANNEIRDRAVHAIGSESHNDSILGDCFAYWASCNQRFFCDPNFIGIFGKQLRVKRMGGVYYHHGIGIENGHVVHFNFPRGNNKNKAIIQCTTLSDFLSGGQLEIVNQKVAFNPLEIRNRALSCLGIDGYNLFENNCEHFSSWCCLQKKESKQVNNAIKATIGTGIGIGLGALIFSIFEESNRHSSNNNYV